MPSLHRSLTTLFLLVLLASWPAGTTIAQKTFVFDPSQEAISLKAHFSVFEDSTGKYTAEELLNHRDLFQPLQGFAPRKQTNSFWLITRFSSTAQTGATIYFNHLSFADLYILADTPGASRTHQRAGSLRPIGDITTGDSRFDLSFKVDRNTPYILLIKSRHTKNYPPIVDFYLSERYRFLQASYNSKLNDLWPQGASALLFLYILLRWVSTRHRPFIWLMLFVGAFNLYGIALNRYLIDWFFSSTPLVGWLLVQHFLHLGLVGLYLLLFDSWELKNKNPLLYKWGKFFVYGLILLSVSVFLLNYYTSNYQLSAKLTINFLLLLVAYSVVLLVRVWKQLDKHELLLAYGLIVFMLANILCSACVYSWGEQAYTIIPGITKAVSIFIAFLFLMGLNGRLRQNSLDKTRYLKELTLLQQHQNELLEENVNHRTKELSQRNAHIEILMNELNHRVKNNLQLLYSLNSLRLSTKDNTDAEGILKDNISRIKAMMLVNENLQLDDNDQLFSLKPFIESIIAHSSQIFKTEDSVTFKASIPRDLILESSLGLPLGLILSELIINSCKHAFSNTASPEISIHVHNQANTWFMSYSDNGSGLAENAPVSFGTKLIRDLARQIRAKMDIVNDNGLTYTFTFSTTAPCVS
ncbi:MAG: histidine kinase dimerization/phosphoacceptor domain -containing protein [Candidatus Pseudobacter hemicellulosilyticus]|uniref:histidine kinase n=1 Tax=Candidatus Pseudobacter hemicellulosilyticus TaxID=3121375 RepID=A0AAJ5WMN2_9BACT|nr:MAG: histidine kinase dimerization/phosphoacceptor domain -containing protein [Pseudobacter sp.]